MLRVGLTGGLATGKSFVGRVLEELGCHLLRADELGHQVLLPGGEAYDGVVREFGREILDEDGSINRRHLATLVFDRPGRLEVLNQLVHPHVVAKEEEWFTGLEAQDPRSIGIVEAAILIETGSYKRFHKMVLTVCSEQEQIARAVKRDGLSHEEVEARIRRQMPLSEKKAFADFVIDTSGSKDATTAKTLSLFEELRRLAI
jgi:dephospho-CoA kinase